jgi:GNAT superfamily N-acetyltransferase
VTGTSVRPATPADAAAIAGVHVRAWQVAYRGLVPDEVLDALSLAQRESAWQALLERNAEGEFTLVAERGSDVVAFCSVIAPSRDDDADSRTCEVAAIYVEPSRWRDGVGSMLLGAALKQVGAAACDHVTLWVFAANDAALAFYRRFGFAPDGAETWHERSGQKEVRLRAALKR